MMAAEQVFNLNSDIQQLRAQAEQVFNLNSDIQQLRAQAKQAKAIVDKVDQVMRMSHRKDAKQKENLIKFLKLSKQLTLAELGYYKNHLEDIKKISPKTAQRFEKSINTYERTSKVVLMDVIPYLEQVDTTRINAKQMVRFVDELENALKRQAAQSKNLELFCYLINDFLNDIMGVGYSIFANTYDPNTMKFQNQELFDQMMSQNPKMIANWMETMMQDAKFHNQTMDYMAKNPEQMNQWMLHDPKHVVEMATAMRENHDFMMAMMSVMMNDPALRLQMQGHMTENPESIEQMKKTMVQNMMDQGMTPDTVSHGGEAVDYVSLIDNLRANDATVNPAGEIEQPFFSVTGFSIQVNGASVQVFEYNSAEDAEADASPVSTDGSSVGTSRPFWVNDPHFYYKEKIIVLYLGDDPAIKELLESVLGSQFAGR